MIRRFFWSALTVLDFAMMVWSLNNGLLGDALVNLLLLPVCIVRLQGPRPASR
jgi:hypothetical protein